MHKAPQTAVSPSHGRLDRMGLIVSGLCMVHCLAGLFLIGLLGLGGGLLLHPAIHRVGLIAAVVSGAATIGDNALRHGHRLPLALGVTGLLLMGGAILSEHGVGEAMMTIAGVALVASAHVINIRRGPCC